MLDFSTAVLIIVIAVYAGHIAYHQVVLGFVDGNNNGKDDRVEYFDSLKEKKKEDNVIDPDILKARKQYYEEQKK
jgi:hypothetical protein